MVYIYLSKGLIGTYVVHVTFLHLASAVRIYPKDQGLCQRKPIDAHSGRNKTGATRTVPCLMPLSTLQTRNPRMFRREPSILQSDDTSAH
jgi:hypothetical protein